MLTYTIVATVVFLALFIDDGRNHNRWGFVLSLLYGAMVVWAVWLLFNHYYPPYNPFRT